MRFDLVDLRLFVHVAETTNITHAASRSNLALASASERIRRMETSAGVGLLKRGRRGVDLTPAGLVFAAHARRVLRQMDDLTRELSSFAGGVKGRVRLLANTSAMSEALPRSLTAFLAANPGLDVDVEEHPSRDIVRLVAEGAAEVGIAADTADLGHLDTIPFRTDRLVLILPARHPLVGRKGLMFREALDEDFVGLPPGSALQQHLAHHAAQAGKPMKLRVRLADFESICRMVADAVGVAVIPESAARRGRRRTAIEAIHLADAWATRRLHVCFRREDELSAPARRLVEHLAAVGGRGSRRPPG